MAGKGSQTQHITKLDFDISEVEAQFQKIEQMVQKTSASLAMVVEGMEKKIQRVLKKYMMKSHQILNKRHQN